MKKTALIIIVLASAVLLAGSVYAMGPGGGMGMGSCMGMGTGTGTTDIEALKKFQQETVSLRDAMFVKRAELQNEFNKTTPDYNKIAVLQKEMIDIRTKIQIIAQKYGLPGPMMGRGMKGGCGMMGTGMKGSGIMGKGMMGGTGSFTQ